MFNRGKGMTLDYAIRLSVNAVAIVVGYRLWTNKPITTFDKIKNLSTIRHKG